MTQVLDRASARFTRAKFYGDPIFSSFSAFNQYQPSDWFWVTKYGAVGNGVTDDSVAIQGALDAAAVRGGTVYFPLPPVAYRAWGLRLEYCRAVKILGAGYGFGSFGSPVGSTIISNGPVGGDITVTTAGSVPGPATNVITVTGGLAVDPLWVGANVHVIEGTPGFGNHFSYKIVSTGVGTITIDRTYEGVGGAGLAATVEPTVLTMWQTWQCTIEDVNLDGNKIAGSNLLTIDGDNLSPPGGATTSRMTYLQRLGLYRAHQGVRIGGSGLRAKQNESVLMDRVDSGEMSLTLGSLGASVLIDSNNASLVEIRNSRFFDSKYVCKTFFSGSLTLDNTYGGSGNQTFLSLQGPWDTVTLRDCEFEPTGGGAFVEVMSPPNGPQTILLLSNLINGPVNDLLSFHSNRTNFVSIGNTYSASVNMGDFGNFLSLGDSWVNFLGPNNPKINRTNLSNIAVIGAEPAGERYLPGFNSQLVTLSLVGTTTDTTAVIPSGCLVSSVTWRVIAPITGPTASYTVGDAVTPDRFASAQAGAQLLLGATGVGMNQMQGNIATAAAGPVQLVDGVVRITCDAIPTGGQIRLTWFYQRFEPPEQ